MSHTKNHLCDKIWVPEEGNSPTPGQPDPCKPIHVMWVTAPSTQPQSPCTAAAAKFWRHFYRLAQPTLQTLGQCMFGLAMLFIIAGIALCIWGYVGTAIRPFQIFGPVCIGMSIWTFNEVYLLPELSSLRESACSWNNKYKMWYTIYKLARVQLIRCLISQFYL